MRCYSTGWILYNITYHVTELDGSAKDSGASIVKNVHVETHVS